MDGGRFRIEAGCRVRKCRRNATLVPAICRLVLSLVTFFAPAKKVTRLQAKAFDFAKEKIKIKCFRAVARVHFFCWPKRNEPKKRAFPDEPPVPAFGRVGIFGLAIPWLDPKTAAIHGGRPPGVLASSLV